MAVNTAAVLPGDIVECDVKGRRFFAVAQSTPEKQPGLGLVVKVEPITKNVNYFNVRGRDIQAHYRKLGRGRS